MAGITEDLKGLGFDESNIRMKQIIEKPEPDAVERITTIYEGEKAKDTIERDGEEVISFERESD